MSSSVTSKVTCFYTLQRKLVIFNLITCFASQTKSFTAMKHLWMLDHDGCDWTQQSQQHFLPPDVQELPEDAECCE